MQNSSSSNMNLNSPSSNSSNSNNNSSTAKNGNLADEQALVQQYLFLLQKSKQYFSGLRELPTNGKFWQPYFQKTFDTFTQLWKFQQEHRQVLEKKDRYGLKRWEIGEIAAKIGQLFYHYYLRTSEINYLDESFIFYEAIRSRGYFKSILQSQSSSLYNKKLRYYARFIVVCLLQNRRDLVWELLEELKAHVSTYITRFNPTDAREWELVTKELEDFLKADSVVTVGNRKQNVSYRVTLSSSKLSLLQKQLQASSAATSSPTITTAPATAATPSNKPLRLSEAILIGNRKKQIKFSELTLDMFRIMQSLELEDEDQPTIDDNTQQPTQQQQHQQQRRKEHGLRQYNPRKSILYRPAISDVQFVLSTASVEMPEGSAMLLYVSADGCSDTIGGGGGGEGSRSNDRGGIAMNPRNPTAPNVVVPLEHNSNNNDLHVLNPHCLTLADIMPFTRRPLFMIIESDNSRFLLPQSSPYGQPMVCLASPLEQPPEFSDPTEVGSIFTFFLTAPIRALCFICGVNVIDYQIYTKCKDEFLKDMGDIVEFFKPEIDAAAPSSQQSFLDNAFTRNYIMKYIFCKAVLAHHSAFADNDACQPRSYPAMPGILKHEPLMALVARITDLLQVRHFFPSLSTTTTTSTTVDNHQ